MQIAGASENRATGNPLSATVSKLATLNVTGAIPTIGEKFALSSILAVTGQDQNSNTYNIGPQPSWQIASGGCAGMSIAVTTRVVYCNPGVAIERLVRIDLVKVFDLLARSYCQSLGATVP